MALQIKLIMAGETKFQCSERVVKDLIGKTFYRYDAGKLSTIKVLKVSKALKVSIEGDYGYNKITKVQLRWLVWWWFNTKSEAFEAELERSEKSLLDNIETVNKLIILSNQLRS